MPAPGAAATHRAAAAPVLAQKLPTHSGAVSTGAATAAVLLPKAGLGVVVLTNGSPIGVAEKIADVVVDDVMRNVPTRDWNKVWSQRYAAPPPGAIPVRPTAAWVGTCTNPYNRASTSAPAPPDRQGGGVAAR